MWEGQAGNRDVESERRQGVGRGGTGHPRFPRGGLGT